MVEYTVIKDAEHDVTQQSAIVQLKQVNWIINYFSVLCLFNKLIYYT